MSHPYFIFDPTYQEDDLVTPFDIDIKVWHQFEGDENPLAIKAAKLWMQHSFINQSQQWPQITQVAPNPNNLSVGYQVGIYSKSHNTSLVMRTANHSLFSLHYDDSCLSANQVVVGYEVRLPDHLSARQQLWFKKINVPYHNHKVILTLDEATLLTHLRVISDAHEKTPILMYQVGNPLLSLVRDELSVMPPSMAALSAMKAQNLIGMRTQFLQQLKIEGLTHANANFAFHCQLNRHLILRMERLHQLKALIFADYCVNTSRYLNHTHKISADWIEFTKISNSDELLYSEYGFNGWFIANYAPNDLLVALVALACCGYWSVHAHGDDPYSLLDTAAEGFALAHKEQSSAAKHLFQIIYNPQNPFDLKKQLLEFNSLMPLLAMICQGNIDDAIKAAQFFDDYERIQSIIPIIDSQTGRQLLIEKFMQLMASSV